MRPEGILRLQQKIEVTEMYGCLVPLLSLSTIELAPSFPERVRSVLNWWDMRNKQEAPSPKFQGVIETFKIYLSIFVKAVLRAFKVLDRPSADLDWIQTKGKPMTVILQRPPTPRIGVGGFPDRPLNLRKPRDVGVSISRAKLRRTLRNFGFLFSILLLACTASRASLAQSPVSIFGSAVPTNAVEADYSAVTLGVKFWSSQAGTISAVRFYRGATSPSGYVARLYSAAGKQLGSVVLAKESGPVPGWQTAVFAHPISIAANTTYVAAYYTPNGKYADGYFGLNNGVTNTPLNAPASSMVGGNGVYYYGLGFPNSTWEASNYYVDVLFTPAASSPAPAPVLSLSFEPPSPSIPNTTPLGATVATIVATWSNGQPFTGTLGFGSPDSNAGNVFAISGNSLIINPSGPGVSGAGGTVEQITIVATQ
jgi:hypothetical protein